MAKLCVRRWCDVGDQPGVGDAIDEIFFESSLKKTFENEIERAAFRERWMGRYQKHYADWFYVAFAGGGSSHVGEVAGYLAGCIADPRTVSLFSDIGYFETFASHVEQFPAHLHINLAPQFRGAGIGGRLIATFFADAARVGISGVHVVTGAGSRNNSFYRRNGFNEIGRADWHSVENVFLGARL